MARACSLTFFGEYRGQGHPHESPLSMTGPLVALAVPSVLIGLVGVPGLRGFGTWVTLAGEAEVAKFRAAPALISVVMALGGVALGYWIYYLKTAPRGLLERVGPLRALHSLLVNRYYLDWLYFNGIVHPVSRQIARASNWVNQSVIDGIVNGVGRVTSRYVSRGTYWVDQKVVDGMVNGTAVSAGQAAGLLRYVQSGRVQQYAAILFLGVATLALALILST
jgi:NADH-quinone oxidoreductase subunit L